MKVIIDRFEGSFAVCEKEGRVMVNIEKVKLPEGAKEGDVLIIEGNKVTVDSEETKNRKQRIEKMMGDLWE